MSKHISALLLLPLLTLLSPRPGWTEEKYEHAVSTTVMAKILQGPNLIQFTRKKMPFSVRTSTALTEANVSSVSTSGLLFGKYASSKVKVDLELKVRITNAQIETPYTPSQIDAIVYDWEETYATPNPLKSFIPRVKRLAFQEGKGLRTETIIKRKHEYLLMFDIPYDETQKKMADVMPELTEVKKFIAAVEGDARGRTIVENNKSGQPPLVIFKTEEDGLLLIQLHHPMHDIYFKKGAKGFDYLYSDELASVAKLPEIKRLVADPQIKAFIFEKPEPIHVRVEGNSVKGFSSVFSRSSGGQLKARLEGKKVTILSL